MGQGSCRTVLTWFGTSSGSAHGPTLRVPSSLRPLSCPAALSHHANTPMHRAPPAPTDCRRPTGHRGGAALLSRTRPGSDGCHHGASHGALRCAGERGERCSCVGALTPSLDLSYEIHAYTASLHVHIGHIPLVLYVVAHMVMPDVIGLGPPRLLVQDPAFRLAE